MHPTRSVVCRWVSRCQLALLRFTPIVFGGRWCAILQFVISEEPPRNCIGAASYSVRKKAFSSIYDLKRQKLFRDAPSNYPARRRNKPNLGLGYLDKIFKTRFVCCNMGYRVDACLYMWDRCWRCPCAHRIFTRMLFLPVRCVGFLTNEVQVKSYVSRWCSLITSSAMLSSI